MLLVVGNLPASRKTTSLNWMDLVIFNNFLCKDLVNIIQFDSQPFISLDGHQVHALGKKTKTFNIRIGGGDLPVTPLKINMEHNHGRLEDYFPF